MMLEGRALVQEKRIVDELMELVQIDSETKHERAICDVLLEKLTALGLDVKEDDTAAKTGHGAGNIIATLPAKPGKEQAPPLLFTAHMDTVVPGRGVKPRLDDDGYIRSDATTILGSDDKAGLAAMLEAIQVLKERKLEHGFVQFIITAGEEAGLVGAQALNKNELKATYGFALDSNEKVGAIAVAAPYQTSMSIEIRGRSAHAGVNPENGISSIQVAG